MRQRRTPSYQKRAAEDAIMVLAGVRGVTNNITVTSRQVRVEDVKGKIEAALKRSAEVDSKTWVERQDAVSAAWSAPGVMNVVDQIRIHA